MTDPVRILLVDDDEEDFILTSDLIDHIGEAPARFDWAEDLDMALEKAQENNYDVFLVDYRLGADTGLELIKAFAEREIDTPIILLTGQGDAEIDRQAMQAGAADYLVKNQVTGPDLERAIRYALSRASTMRQLAEREKRLGAIMSTVADGIIAINSHGTIEAFNKSAERMFGYLSNEIVGSNIRVLMPDFLIPSHDSAIKNFAYSQAQNQTRSLKDNPSVLPKHIELQGRRKDGTTFPMELLFAKMTLEGELHYTGVVRDISERKQAEAERARLLDQFHRAQKMEALGTLAGGIAHDFNNILNIIMAYADSAMGSIDPDHPAQAAIEQIIDSSERAVSLVRQVLAYSREDSKERLGLDMNKVIGDFVSMLSPTLPKGVSLDLKLFDQDLSALCDPNQIQQVLMNLCINARHALPQDQGLIAISLNQVTIDADYLSKNRLSVNHEATSGPPTTLYCDPNSLKCHAFIGVFALGQYVSIKVDDSGSGMDITTLGRIFDPFFTTKRVGEGTGLGLSAVQGIILSHGGAIRVDTEKSKGSSFEVLLPLHGGIDVLSTSSPAKKETPKLSGNVLLVDDEHALVTINAENLERFGYVCTAIDDPLAALTIFKKRPEAWDIAVLDYNMAGMNGMELARNLIQIKPSMRIVLCSGQGHPLEHSKLKKLGIQEVLLKPVSATTIAEAIENTR